MTGDAIVALVLSDWVMLQMPGVFEHGGVELHRGSRPAWDLASSELVPSRELKNFDRQSLLLLAAMSLIEDGNHGDSLARSAIIGATSNGSIDTVIQLIKESNESRFAFQVNPAQIPNTVINSSLGQLAIKYGIKGPNVSLCAKELSFYNALVQASRIAMRGESDYIYTTAMETFSGEFGTLYAQSINLPAEERLDTAAIFSFQVCIDLKAPGLIVRSCMTGRLLPSNAAGLIDLVLSFLAEQGVDLDELSRINLAAPDSWQMSSNILNLAFGGRFEMLDRSKALSLSLVGAYQLAEIANGLRPQSFGVMVCVDDEGFYGVALIERVDVREGFFTGSSDSGKADNL
jgi:hypothetical protein